MTQTALLLNYSHDQRRWTRNLSYLLAIVCIMQLSLLPVSPEETPPPAQVQAAG